MHHAPRATCHAPRKTKNSVPPLFLEKAGDKNIISLSCAELAHRVVIFKEGPPKMCIYLWSSSILYILFCLDTTSLGYIQNHAIMNYVTKRFHN